jgi:hypothetical protein
VISWFQLTVLTPDRPRPETSQATLVPDKVNERAWNARRGRRTGLAGNAAAWALSKHYPATVYDRDIRLGGHSHTVTIDYDGTRFAVDIGFFNPLSVYFCYRADGELAVMIYEVRNTFGDIYTYVLPVTEGESGDACVRHNRSNCFTSHPSST